MIIKILLIYAISVRVSEFSQSRRKQSVASSNRVNLFVLLFQMKQKSEKLFRAFS